MKAEVCSGVEELKKAVKDRTDIQRIETLGGSGEGSKTVYVVYFTGRQAGRK